MFTVDLSHNLIHKVVSTLFTKPWFIKWSQSLFTKPWFIKWSHSLFTKPGFINWSQSRCIYHDHHDQSPPTGSPHPLSEWLDGEDIRRSIPCSILAFIFGATLETKQLFSYSFIDYSFIEYELKSWCVAASYEYKCSI